MSGRAWVAGAALSVLATIAVGGCGSASSGTDGPAPAASPMRCVQPPGRLSGTQVLMAQAVPSASLIPCVREEVDNWDVTELDVGRGKVRVLLEYRPGDTDVVTIEISPQCDTRGTREVSSEHNGVRRYDRGEIKTTHRYASERIYTYPGACTSLRLSLTGRHADLRAAELTSVFGFVERSDLDERVGEVTGRRLHLDPPNRR